MSSFLERRGIACPVLDLNILARQALLKEPELGPDVQSRRNLLDDVFSLGRRTHLAELMAWSWLDPNGLDGVVRRIQSHPSPLIRQFWVLQGIEKPRDGPLARAGDLLRRWLDRQVQAIASAATDWVGFSAVITNLAATVYLAKQLRKVNPRLLLLLGGAHLSERNAASILHAFPEFDAIIPAPAYLPTADVIRAHREGKPLAGLQGVWTWNGARGDTLVSDATKRWVDLDSLAPANWSTLPLALYESGFRLKNRTGDFSRWYPTIPLQTSRGCSFSRCKFCHNVVDYPKYRMQSPERVAVEIQHQIEQLGTRGFFFTDDEFVGSRKRTEEICDRLIALDEDIRFFCWLRLDSIDLPLLEKMYAAGARQLFIGCEAVDDDLLGLMNKGYGASLAASQLNLLYNFWEDHEDFTYTFNLIVDYPGETMKAVKNTLAIIGEDPHLFYDRVAACCRFHLYEGTPEFAERGEGAVGCLEALPPPEAQMPSFRYLYDRDTPDTEERLRMWEEVAEFVRFKGGKELAGEARTTALIYD
jgi:tRNA A37 methylthiotransferase MiaB